ncbi:hypothetical protein KEM55_007154, partial [Ascosphaera atra]
EQGEKRKRGVGPATPEKRRKSGPVSPEKGKKKETRRAVAPAGQKPAGGEAGEKVEEPAGRPVDRARFLQLKERVAEWPDQSLPRLVRSAVDLHDWEKLWGVLRKAEELAAMKVAQLRESEEFES